MFINYIYKPRLINLKINFWNIFSDCLIWNSKNGCQFILFVFMIAATSGFLIENIPLLQKVQAQNNDNSPSNTITQGVLNQLNKTFSNTPLAGSNFLSQPSNNNNGPPEQSNNNIATQQSSSSGSSSSNNNNIVSQQSNNIAAQQSNSIPNAQQGSIPIGNNFILSGPLSSFLSTPTGNWVVNGTWILKVQNGALSFFTGNMQWDPTNLTKVPHSHNFANFRADPNTQSISLGSDRITDIKGIMDIGANNKIEWINVPAEIKTAGNTITVFILDDSKTGNHFNNYPIFGKIAHIEKCSDNGGFGANMDFDPSIGKCSL
jgi:hypothetical protein